MAETSPQAGEPINPDIVMGMTLLCLLSGLVFFTSALLPDMVGQVLSAEVVLGAGMTFAATFLITIALIPEEYSNAGDT